MSTRDMPRPIRAAAALIALTALTAVVTACGGPSDGGAATAPSTRGATASSSSPRDSDGSSSAPDPHRDAALAAKRARKAARAEIAKVVHSVPQHAAGVAALDITTGKSVVAGSRQRMWTASMYKLLVLETLLREDGPLSGYQLDEAVQMIEQSDNAAGWDLWLAGGSNGGLEQTMDALGMRHSVADGPDPTFTELTPADALRMVRALVRPGVLSAAARRQAIGLMRNVESDQRWGVGVVADPGTDFANKNGWLAVDDGNGAGFDDDGRWVVTSVGIVTVQGHRVLMAAMTNHNSTEPDGIRAVQQLAKAAVVLLGDG